MNQPINILITGASEGIGRELSKLFAHSNNNIYLIARNKERLESLKQEMNKSEANVHFISCDVSDYNQCKATFDIAKGEFGSIDIAILNAGMGLNSTLAEPHLDRAMTTMSVNYFGVVNFGQILFPYFKKKGCGTFVGVSSLADVRGFEGSGIYCSSKAAVSSYLESARSEMKQYGVKVITIKPGFVDTNMTKKNKHAMPFIMTPQKAATKMYKAIIKGRSSYSFPWQTQLGAYMLRVIPNNVYDYLSQLRGKLGQ